MWLTGDAYLENTGADLGGDNTFAAEYAQRTTGGPRHGRSTAAGPVLEATRNQDAGADQDIPGTGLTYSADAAIDGAITSVSG